MLQTDHHLLPLKLQRDYQFMVSSMQQSQYLETGFGKLDVVMFVMVNFITCGMDCMHANAIHIWTEFFRLCGKCIHLLFFYGRLSNGIEQFFVQTVLRSFEEFLFGSTNEELMRKNSNLKQQKHRTNFRTNLQKFIEINTFTAYNTADLIICTTLLFFKLT